MKIPVDFNKRWDEYDACSAFTLHCMTQLREINPSVADSIVEQYHNDKDYQVNVSITIENVEIDAKKFIERIYKMSSDYREELVEKRFNEKFDKIFWEKCESLRDTIDDFNTEIVKKIKNEFSIDLKKED